MKRLITLTLVLLVATSFIGFGCGSHTTSQCDCAICINDVPAYPCDSEESCEDFAADQACNTWQLVDDPTETCGEDPQPVCEVSDCDGQCQCPGESS